MPAGDPAGYLPNVKRSRKQRLTPAVKPYKSRKARTVGQVSELGNKAGLMRGLGGNVEPKRNPKRKLFKARAR